MTVVLDYMERLRPLAINNARFAEDCLCGAGVDSAELDPKTLKLVRAGSVDHGRCTVPSHGAQADAAVNAGATAAEIVDVLIGVVPIVCLPYVAAAAPKLATVLRELGLTSDQVWGLTKRRLVGST